MGGGMRECCSRDTARRYSASQSLIVSNVSEKHVAFLTPHQSTAPATLKGHKNIQGPPGLAPQSQICMLKFVVTV